MNCFKNSINLSTLSLALLGVLLTFSIAEAKEQKGDMWTGRLEDGTIIRVEDLRSILKEHLRWIYLKKKWGQIYV